MNVYRVACVLAVLFLPVTAFSEDDATSTAALSEWQIRNVWRIEFEGNQSFSADNIRRALAINPATQATVADSIPREKFVATVAAQVQAGYHEQGFREAKVSAAFDEQNGVVRAVIIEGPRYTIEALPAVEGVDGPVQAAIHRVLTTPRPAPKPNNPFATDAALWQEGAHRLPSEDSQKKIRQAIEQCLAQHGYYFAVFETRLEIDDVNRSIGLTVAVDKLDAPLRMSGIEFTGLKRHSAQQVTDYLMIEPDAILNAALHEHIRKRLLDSARFLVANSWNEVPFGPDNRVALHIDVREFDGSPLLTEEFSEKQVELLRCARWLNQWHENGDDIRLSLDADLTGVTGPPDDNKDSTDRPAAAQNATSSFTQAFLQSLSLRDLHSELIVSRSHGTQASLIVLNADGDSVIDLVSNQSGQGLRLISRHRQSVWHREQLAGMPFATARWAGIPIDPNSETSGTASFALSFGFNSKARNSPLMNFDVTPAAWLSSFRSDDAVFEDGETPGSCRVTVDDAFLEYDRESGMLHSAELLLAPHRLRVRRDPGAVQHELAKLDVETATWQNEHREDRALSSLIAFAASECADLCRKGGIETAPLLLRVLQDPDVFGNSVEQALSTFNDDWFSIPSAGQQLSGANWQFHLAMAVLPPGSTAHRMAAASVGAQMTGDFRSLEHLLMEIDQDDSHGPIDCLAAAFLIKKLRPRMAQLGLDRLSIDAATRDLQPLISERSVLSDILCGGIRFVRSLSDEEAEILIQAAGQLHVRSKRADDEFTSPNVAPLFVMIRSHPSDKPAEIASSLLPLIWTAGLETAVRDQLVEYRHEKRPDSVFRTATQSTREGQPESPNPGRREPRRSGKTEKGKNSGDSAVEIPDGIESIYKPSRRILRPSSGPK